MKNTVAVAEEQATDLNSPASKSVFGFWIYLMTDCVLFASLFAAFAVLRGSTYTGPTSVEIFKLPGVLAETLILLTSSFTCGLGMLAANRGNKRQVLGWFSATFLLGASFLTLELTEFRHLVTEGNSWRVSGFLSSFFTLVGTHGLHITFGLLWVAVLLINIKKRGLAPSLVKKLRYLAMFWHFLDIVWIFIFTIVYLMGTIKL